MSDANGYVLCCFLQGKERKKGQKEINRDNKETLAFYRIFTAVACVSTLIIVHSDETLLIWSLLYNRLFKSPT